MLEFNFRERLRQEFALRQARNARYSLRAFATFLSADFVELFIGLDSVKGFAAKAEGLGAKIPIPPTVLPEGDEVAALPDPAGMLFAVWRHAGR